MNTSDLFIEYIIIGLITVCGIITGICILNGTYLIDFIINHLLSESSNLANYGTLLTILLIYPLGMITDNIAKFIAKPMYRSSFFLYGTYYFPKGIREKEDRLKIAHNMQSLDRLEILKSGNSNFIYQYKRQKHYTYVLRTLFVLSLINLYLSLYVLLNQYNSRYIILLVLIIILTRINDEVFNFFRRNMILMLDYFEFESKCTYENKVMCYKSVKIIRALLVTLFSVFIFTFYLKALDSIGYEVVLRNINASVSMTLFTFLMYYYRTRKWFNVRRELALELYK